MPTGKLYHGTNPLSLSKIRKTGLCVMPKNQRRYIISHDGIYVSTDVSIAGMFASHWPLKHARIRDRTQPKPAIIRFDVADIKNTCSLLPDVYSVEDSYLLTCDSTCIKPKSAEFCFTHMIDANDCDGKWKPIRWANMSPKRRGYDDRPLDEQINEFLNQYGLGKNPDDLFGTLLDGIQSGDIGPSVVKSVQTDPKTGKTKIVAEPILPKAKFEKQVEIAKKMETDLNAFMDKLWGEEAAKEKDVKPYTQEDLERDFPIDKQIQGERGRILFALERVRTAQKEHTKKRYVRNVQVAIWDLQKLQDEWRKRHGTDPPKGLYK